VLFFLKNYGQNGFLNNETSCYGKNFCRQKKKEKKKKRKEKKKKKKRRGNY